ncbi:DUF3775 domain-containing protein [Thiohalobacter sp. IOR34]|uniref:DUF3775 domain-containing protein n=1 Tax=Thiohalobacter sp. IOR34 TaxID=3057176 RepID=UPI0025B181F8|nr:DUF3775 domain-containing protein [Thiohalobacter sp. IOR34]WJW76414.1 DUF3775 domain-containing protein [Thiohalobacter sp. IOR34]
MLDINPETVCFIIAKAHEFHAKEQVVIPEEPLSPSDDWALQVLADHADDLTYRELKSTIDDLEPDQQATLVALMWLGRGDFGIDEWESALQQAQESLNECTLAYLIATPLLADYLQEGLFQFGYSCEE